MTSQKRNPKQDWGYYAITPRIVRTQYKQLSHTEKWLYVCLKDLCGDKGTCYRTLRVLSEETDLSIGNLSTGIRHLHEAGLIHAEKKRRSNNPTAKEVWHISIVDIWQSNVEYCSKNEHSQEDVQTVNNNVQNLNEPSPQCSENEQKRSNFVDRSNNNEEEQSEVITIEEECVSIPTIDTHTFDSSIEGEHEGTTTTAFSQAQQNGQVREGVPDSTELSLTPQVSPMAPSHSMDRTGTPPSLPNQVESPPADDKSAVNKQDLIIRRKWAELYLNKNGITKDDLRKAFSLRKEWIKAYGAYGDKEWDDKAFIWIIQQENGTFESIKRIYQSIRRDRPKAGIHPETIQINWYRLGNEQDESASSSHSSSERPSFIVSEETSKRNLERLRQKAEAAQANRQPPMQTASHDLSLHERIVS